MVFGICCLLPLAWLAWQVGSRPDTWGQMTLNRFRADLLGRTLLYNGISATLAVLVAIPGAVVVGRGRGWLSKAMLVALPLSLIMPSVSYNYGWLQVLRLFDIEFAPQSWPDVLRSIWVLASWLWPAAALIVGLALRISDAQVQQQALLDGALRRVLARQLSGPFLAAWAVVMLLAVQEFSAYERSGISVFATEIRTAFVQGDGDQAEKTAQAVATGMPMLIVVGGLSIAAFLGLRRLAGEGVEQDWPRILDARWWWQLLAWLALLATVAVPTVAMAASISPDRLGVDARGQGPMMRVLLWTGPYAVGSLLYGALTGLVGVLIGMLACVRRSRALLAMGVGAFLLGGALLAIADIRVYNAPMRVAGRYPLGWVYNSAAVMIIGYIGRFGWLALLAGELAWSGGVRELRGMSAVDGAGAVRTARDVIWPIAWPMVMASAVLMMAMSMTEVSMTVLLAPLRPQPLINELMNWVHYQRSDEMLEGTLLLMAMTLVLGVAAIGLAWMGWRWLGTRATGRIGCVLGLLVIAGCGDGVEPEAIWCETGPGPGQLIYPRGVAYSPRDDCLFVVDRMARIQRLEADGRASAEWRMPLWQNGKPVGLTVGPDGNLYVPDTHYFRVMVYTPAGRLLHQWGERGKGPGQFVYPTDVAFDAQGNIYVAEYGDRDSDRIQVFDPEAKNVLRVIGSFGTGDGQFSRPQSIVVSGDMLYVADACNHRIVTFRTDGTFVRNLGTVGSGLGQFRFPYGLDMDRQGRLLVSEYGNNRVQMIDPRTGQGLRTWGVPGREPGQLACPWGLAVDKRGRVMVLDSGNNRIQVFSW